MRPCCKWLPTAAVVVCALNFGQAEIPKPAWPLRVKTVEIVPGVQKAWLEDQQGTPFFYNADTCWFLAFRATDAEVCDYLRDRAQKKITVVQCMLLPGTRAGEDHWFGEKPFINQQMDQPNEAYWQHVDFVIEEARRQQITLSMALAWNGCCGEGWAQVLNNDYHRQRDFAALKAYAQFVGRRYAQAANLTVFLGGDGSVNHRQYQQMAESLKQTAPHLLIAHHPSSWYGHPSTKGIKSSTCLEEHGQGDYLDISWTYTYWPGQNNREHAHPYYLNHLEWNRNQQVPAEVSRVRPFLLGEAGYENERGSPRHRLRRLMHWNFVCGASGQAFGNGSLWGLRDGWRQQLHSPGSVALGRMFDV